MDTNRKHEPRKSLTQLLREGVQATRVGNHVHFSIPRSEYVRALRDQERLENTAKKAVARKHTITRQNNALALANRLRDEALIKAYGVDSGDGGSKGRAWPGCGPNSVKDYKPSDADRAKIGLVAST